MRRALRVMGSLAGLVAVGVLLVAIALTFSARGQPQMAQQPYPPPQTPTMPAPSPPGTPSLEPYPPPATPIPTATSPPPIPTPPLPPTAVAMDTYTSRTLIVAPVGSGPGEMGVFEMPEIRPVVPGAIALDNEGNLYISDSHNRRVVKYDSEGNFVAAIPLRLPMSVKDIRVGSDGTIYLLEGGGAFVRRINQNGELLLEYPKPDWVRLLISFRLDAADTLWAKVSVESDFPSGHAIVPLGNAQEVFSHQRQLDGATAGYSLGDMVYVRGRRSDHGTEMQGFDQAGDMIIRLGPFDPGRVPFDIEPDKSENLYFLMAVLTERVPLEIRKFNRDRSLVARFLVPHPYVAPSRQIAMDNAENVYYLLPQKDQVLVIKYEKQQTQ